MVAQLALARRQIRRTAPQLRTARYIAEHLEEPGRAALEQIVRLVQCLGEERALAFLRRTLTLEAEGRVAAADSAPRRSRGGIYFYLVRTEVSIADQVYIFPFSRLERSRYRGQTGLGTQQGTASHTGGFPVAETQEASGAREPLSFAAAPCVTPPTEMQTIEGTQSVKVTVIGRPHQIAESGEAVILTLGSTAVPALPSGVPVPSAPTLCVALVARDQWNLVAKEAAQPHHLLAIEGYPSVDPHGVSLTIHCTSITTKESQS